MSLVDELIKPLLEEEKKTVAVYGGGFKPPTAGHFEVVDQALKENPNIDEFIILIGGKERDGISPEESLIIWDIYKQYLPIKVEVKLSPKPPIQAVYNYAKEHPNEEVLFVIGAREGNEDDFSDITKRTKSLDKYDNLELRTIVTQGGASGTAARNAAKISTEKLRPLLPKELKDEEVEEIFNILSDVVKENDPEDGKAAPYGSGYKKLNENASYKEDIDIQDKIDRLTQHMISKGMNIEPLPSLEFVDGDSENAKDFFGRTAYYDPNRQHIVLYTEGRHPKDIVRSYAHEMIHHIQNLEDRLGNISGTNTMEDDHLNKLEQEANLMGTMTFRNWTDSLNENLKEGKQVGLLYHSTYPSTLKTILDQNILKGNLATYNGKDVLAISTTRNKNFKYEDRKAQIVLDGDKLSTKYKIRPYDYWDRNYNRRNNPQAKDEDEEIILTSKIPNIKDYIVGINLDKPLNEAIVGDKIECDKCGWSWKIADGGDDLFICHKCGNDNEPINEAKPYKHKHGFDDKLGKDPFGLNQFAREIAEGALLPEEEVVSSPPMEYKIYSDMDGVLTDFDKSFEKYSKGIPPREYEKKFGKDGFWKLIDGEGKVGFWVGMPWMEDAKQYWDYIKDYDVELLSSPSRSETSRLGKRLWVRNNMPGIKLTLAQAYNKKNYAEPNHILIDDRESNIDQWRAAGGIGILHTSAADTIQQLKKLGL